MIQPGAIVLKGLTALVWALLLASTGVFAQPATLNWQDLLPDPNVELGDANKGVPHWERVRADLNKKEVRIPGFIVPLEFDDEQTVTQFFLVPYFGACLHMPPPPPNQIILVNSPQGVQLSALYDPFWVKGELHTTFQENDMATSAYSMAMLDLEPYTY